MKEVPASLLQQFSQDRFLVVRQLLDADEIAIVREALTSDPAIRRHRFTPKDAGGNDADIVAWSQFGCREPLMASVMIAIDHADRENGCLQAIRGSQRHGSLLHRTIGTQQGVDATLVDAALDVGEHVYCELCAGDAAFFIATCCTDLMSTSRLVGAGRCCIVTTPH